MKPVADERPSARRLRLRDLVVVVGTCEVFASHMYVDLGAEERSTHRRTFNVPARITEPPRAVPHLQVALLRPAPERKVRRVAFPLHFRDTRALDQLRL